MTNQATVLHLFNEINDELPAPYKDGESIDHSGLQYFLPNDKSPVKPDDAILDYFA